MLYHNSRDLNYRSPFGAAACGQEVMLRLRATGEPMSVVLRTWKDGQEERYEMAPCGHELYETAIRLDYPGNLWYYFIADYGHETLYYGNAKDGLGGEGDRYGCEPPSFQISVFNEDAGAPEWMREAVIYQVMVDRFYASKPPSKSDYPDGAHLHSSVFEPPLNKIEGGDNLARDFYGGDLKGLCEKLPYLNALGVKALYLNPIFSSPSNHKYDTADYELIDPAFGSNEDFTALLKSAESLGIRVILDGVFSHTGSDSRYFNKNARFEGPGAYQSKDSPYFSWYQFTRWPDEYKSWWGFSTLPEVDKSSESFMRYIIEDEDAIIARWLRAGASGWRLDVADELPLAFLRRLRARVKALNRENALIGEVWEDPSNKVAYGEARNYTTGDTLDSCMNYPLREALIDFMLFRIDAPALIRRIEAQRENTPPAFFYSMMNLLGSHDKPRILAILSGRDNLEPPREERKPLTLTDAEYALARRRFIALYRFLTSLPGMPCLYYGDEAGLVGMSDPFCRGAYPWGREDKALVSAIAAANALRSAHGVLAAGHIRLYAPSKDVVVCERYTIDARDAFGAPIADENAIFALNRADEARAYRLPSGEMTTGAIDCDCQLKTLL